MSDFDDLAAVAVDAVFDLHGNAASYVPPGGGSPSACVVAIDHRDSNRKADDGTPPSGYVTIEVRASDIAAPAHGGTFTVTEGTKAGEYQVANRPMPVDANGLVWTMWADPK